MTPSSDERTLGYETPVDRALSLFAEGEHQQALRWVLPLLEEQPLSAQALLTTAKLLGALGRNGSALEGFTESAQRAARSGHLALAAAACAEATQLGADVSGLLAEVATQFCRDSALLTDAPTPPELHPAKPDFKPFPQGPNSSKLLERAENALFTAVAISEQERAQKPARKLGKQPLFSALSKEGLRATLGALDVQTVAAGTVLIKQGDAGERAFVLARGELEVQRSGRDQQPPTLLARLGAGCLFGEMALLSRSPRSASVVARRPSIVLSASKTALDQLAAEQSEIGSVLAEFCRKRMFDNLIRTSPVLSELSTRERTRVLKRFTTRTFEAGHCLIRQGERTAGLFLLASGSVQIVHHQGDDRTVVAQLSVGDMVGEVSAILRRESNADVLTQTPTVALYLPSDELLELVREHPRLLLSLYELAVAREVETDYLALQAASSVDESVLI